jgi:hypothetical protein
MAATSRRSHDDVRREIEAERDRLATAVSELRTELGKATDVAAKLRARLPLVAAGAAAVGFVVAGGIRATARLAFRRRRRGTTKGRVGRFGLGNRR